MDCPDASLWVSWRAGSLSPEEQERLGPHLAECPSCRQELNALVRAEGPARRPWLPWAAAAALLLSAGILAFRRPEPARSRQAPPAWAPALVEWRIGRTGAAALEPGSKGRMEGAALVLESGSAWVESSGDRLRIRIPGWEDVLELEDGAALVRRAAPSPSAWIAEAWASEIEPVVLVARGKVRSLAGREWVPGAEVPPDPRAWRVLVRGPANARDSVLGFPWPEGCRTLEVLLRKRAPSAEVALRFPAGGRLWEAPLGGLAPTGTWVRLRLELGERVRLLAGDREYFAARTEALSTLIPSVSDGGKPGIRAWGGDVEVAEARWR